MSNAKSHKPRQKRAITPQYLNNVAEYYLGRYAATAHSLEQVLLRRLYRNQAQKDAAALAMVGQIVQKYRDLGVIDDDQFAWRKTRSLAESGKSQAQIRQKLQQKGIAKDIIDVAMKKAAAENPAAEYAAAVRLAKRKKLGPYRTRADACPKRELQKMAQAGFSYALAKQVLSLTIDAIDDE